MQTKYHKKGLSNLSLDELSPLFAHHHHDCTKDLQKSFKNGKAFFVCDLILEVDKITLIIVITI